MGKSAPRIPELRVELRIYICRLIILRHILSSLDSVISVISVVAWDLFPEIIPIKATGRSKVIVSLVVEFICLERLVLWRRSSEQGFPGHIRVVFIAACHVAEFCVETVLEVGPEVGQKGWIAAHEGGELSFIHDSKVW